MRTSKELLKKQIEVYLGWAIRNRVATNDYREWLDLLCKYTDKNDVLDITEEDVDLFLAGVDNKENATYRKSQARRAIYSFRRYYMARSKNGKTRMGRGRPPIQEGIEKVKALRALEVPLTFRQIARALNEDVRQIYRWYKYTRDVKK